MSDVSILQRHNLRRFSFFGRPFALFPANGKIESFSSKEKYFACKNKQKQTETEKESATFSKRNIY